MDFPPLVKWAPRWQRRSGGTPQPLRGAALTAPSLSPAAFRSTAGLVPRSRGVSFTVWIYVSNVSES